MFSNTGNLNLASEFSFSKICFLRFSKVQNYNETTFFSLKSTNQSCTYEFYGFSLIVWFVLIPFHSCYKQMKVFWKSYSLKNLRLDNFSNFPTVKDFFIIFFAKNARFWTFSAAIIGNLGRGIRFWQQNKKIQKFKDPKTIKCSLTSGRFRKSGGKSFIGTDSITEKHRIDFKNGSLCLSNNRQFFWKITQ